MYVKIRDKLIEVVIDKKKTTKNTYMRVKDDGKIYLTTNYFTSDKKIVELLENHLEPITKMVEDQDKKQAYLKKFYYLGHVYDIVYTNINEINLGIDKVFVGRNLDINKWYLGEAKTIFKEHLDLLYRDFLYKIPYPSLKIRSMKTRWGVCHTKDYTITLNLELIKKDISCLDYVIIHELAHLVEANHKAAFWKIVSEHCPNYKEIRKHMKEYE
ncbi:MAG: SprT family zinc-dependent metalloprotease [Bacilli bacterium]